MSLGDMLDRFPALGLAELKPGELVAVAAAESEETSNAPTRASALLAGIEPLLVPAGGGQRDAATLQTGLAQGALDLGMGMGE